MRVVAAALCCVALMAGAVSARAEGDGGHVIAPGQEQLLGKLLGGAIGGCQLSGASIKMDHVEASYACSSGPVAVELRHPSSAQAAVRTERFAVVVPGAAAPAELLRDLEKSLRANEAAWAWSQPSAGPARPPAEARTPEEDAAYQHGLDLYRDKKFAEAYEVYVDLARRSRKPGVLGMVVASLASTHPTKERVAELMAAADRAPGDVLQQFAAGVGAHYYAHQSAPSKEAKRPYYEMAIKYLSRADPAYAAEPRLWIYLAVSNFRLGHQGEAETLIERAVALGADDPDAYYCRAEIFQQKNLERSLADLDFYLAQMEKNEASSHISAPEKTARVQRMKAYLVAVSRGERQPVDLFDPAAEDEGGTGSGARRWIALAGAGGIVAAILALRARRRAPAS